MCFLISSVSPKPVLMIDDGLCLASIFDLRLMNQCPPLKLSGPHSLVLCTESDRGSKYLKHDHNLSPSTNDTLEVQPKFDVRRVSSSFAGIKQLILLFAAQLNLSLRLAHSQFGGLAKSVNLV